jgi:nucleotide-binding universal stress UspA family protein
VSVAVVVGPAAYKIVRYAGAQGADVLVLGSHGRGVIRRFLIGSVAERVLREAVCPVMFVPDRALRDAVTELRTLRLASASRLA